MYLSNKQLSTVAEDFIDDGMLTDLIKNTEPDAAAVEDIVAKSLDKKPLDLNETAMLLAVEEPKLLERIFDAARQLKRTVYGNRIVIFAPLYIGNKCINDCGYCGFKASNDNVNRRTLRMEEIAEQVTALENVGHKRLILVYGEHPDYDSRFIADSVRQVYKTKVGNGEIRRVNINAAPLDTEGFKEVKQAGIGTYQIFMETYHHDTYSKYHPSRTRKGDYLYRLDGLNRAFEAGCDDVGIGALFGLYDYRFDTLALVRHALFLQDKYGVGPHTISFPRLQAANGIDIDTRYMVSDDNFKKLIAVLRLAVPYTGLILTARENAKLRRDVMEFGVSQIDAGSNINLGGYAECGDAQVMENKQFSLGDIRSLDEVMRELIEDDFVPSFCTSCYRKGRTGEHFMEFAIPGFIKRFCTPNALTTLEEYLVDYASEQTRISGEKLIQRELDKLPDDKSKETLIERINLIKQTDQRDIYF